MYVWKYTNAFCYISLSIFIFLSIVYITTECNGQGFTTHQTRSTTKLLAFRVEPPTWLQVTSIGLRQDDVIKWKHFPRYWPSVRGIHWSPVNSPHKGQWRRALVFSLICALNKWLSKHSWGWWFETPSCSLIRHCNGTQTGTMLLMITKYYRNQRAGFAKSHSWAVWIVLIHWGQVTHICVSKLTTIGPDHSLSPGRHQVII